MIDTQSRQWALIAKWANEQLETARKQNENPQLDPIKTAVLRGRIMAFKDLLAIPVKAVASPLEPNDPYL